jgi:hypothetical protein
MRYATLVLTLGSAATVLLSGVPSIANDKAFVAEITLVDRHEGGHVRRVSNKVPSGEEIGLQSTLEANDHIYLRMAKIVYRQCGVIEVKQEAREVEKDWLLPRTCNPSDNDILPDIPGTVTASFTQAGDPEAAKAFLSNVVGTNVYNVKDKSLGQIKDILLSADQKPTAAIVGLGGSLGASDKSVAVSFDKIELVRDGKGPVRVYVLFNQDELKAQSTFMIETYPGQRTLLSDR